MIIDLERTIKILKKAKDFANVGIFRAGHKQCGGASINAKDCIWNAIDFYCNPLLGQATGDPDVSPNMYALNVEKSLVMNICLKSLTLISLDLDITFIDKRTFLRLIDFTIDSLRIQVRNFNQIHTQYPHLEDRINAMKEGVSNADKKTHEEEKQISTVERVQTRKINI